MKILYAVAGEGSGHATRSRVIIEYLRKRHTVKIVAGGKAFAYLRKHFPVAWTASMYIVYRNNAVSEILTVLLNIVRTPFYLFSFIRMIFLMLSNRPDVFVTDFEPWSTYAALLTGVPVVSIDNEHIITQAKLNLLQKHWLSFAKAWLVTKTIIPFAHATLILSFFFPKLKHARSQYLHPIIRKEIVALKPTTGKHILVYQTSSTNKQLLNILKQFPNQLFVVYGFTKKGNEKNIDFKQFNEKDFFNDLASAKAVITNGGFSLMTEAIYLHKPILSIPIKGQCEQVINAYYLQKLGYGIMTNNPSVAIIRKFLLRLPVLREALKTLPKWNVQQQLKKIDGVIRRVAK